MLVAWSSVATLIGIAQWLGWGIVGAWPQGRRQPSFLGPHDFAALSGMTLLVGIVGLLWRAEGTVLRRGAWVAVAAGAIGFVLGGASAGIVGLVPAALFAVAVAARRAVVGRRALAATLATVAIASLGVVVLRAGDFGQFFSFLGVRQANTSSSTDIQTYSQRTLLAYIGARIWLHHPIVGAGWQGSTEDSTVRPELPAAHKRFPDLAARAFPGPGHEYGVQILYVQALADLGIVGFVLMLVWLGVPLVMGMRAAWRAPPQLAWIPTLGVCWLVLALGLWAAIGLVAGIPLDALGWLAIGTIAAGLSAAVRADSGRMRA
jgi:O-antigen ligase